jgi:hypothetical protein
VRYRNNPFRLGPGKSALGNLPEDEARFPVATWFKRMLMEGVQRIVLSSEALRRPSPPGLPRMLLPDGSNLPWIVAALEREHDTSLKRWVAHLKTALPDLKDIRTIERAEDKHRYIVLVYSGGLEAPSWLVSPQTPKRLLILRPAKQGCHGLPPSVNLLPQKSALKDARMDHFRSCWLYCKIGSVNHPAFPDSA